VLSSKRSKNLPVAPVVIVNPALISKQPPKFASEPVELPPPDDPDPEEDVELLSDDVDVDVDVDVDIEEPSSPLSSPLPDPIEPEPELPMPGIMEGGIVPFPPDLHWERQPTSCLSLYSNSDGETTTTVSCTSETYGLTLEGISSDDEEESRFDFVGAIMSDLSSVRSTMVRLVVELEPRVRFVGTWTDLLSDASSWSCSVADVSRAMKTFVVTVSSKAEMPSVS
jgi:hypothetical protein